MHVDVREIDDTVVVDFNGRLVLGVGDEILREVMDELVGEGWKKIVLNLGEVDRIDSAGVGELVSSVRMAAKFDTKVNLVRMGDRAHRVLQISHVLPLLSFFDTVDEAVSSFRKAQ
jgi:anti-sigma B factor antagonist